MVTVVLCICTCRRPKGLSRLLSAVADLDFEGELSVVVVENDQLQEGLGVCRNLLEKSYRWPLTSVFEKQPGISFARNRAVRVALDQTPDFIAMLDDDEWPSRRWLSELLRVRVLKDADVVGGPVLPIFPPGSGPWSNLAEYYGVDQHRPDAESCVLYASGNFLGRSACLQALMPAPFDPAFARSGGEDLVFFRRLAKRGYRMCWSVHGVVYEEVPSSRMNLEWLKQRQIRRGNLNVIVQRMFAPGAINEGIRVVKTAGLLILSFAFYTVALPHRMSRIHASLLLHKALGKFRGHFGYRYFEYTTIHGN